MKPSPFYSTAFSLIITIIFSFHFQVSSLGSGSTIAISYEASNSITVCGIVSGEILQRIQCYKQGQAIFIQPNISYESISGGFGFFCGLRSGGISLLCWDTETFLAKRVYYDKNVPLRDLAVGDYQVCAVEDISGVSICWRFESPEAEWQFKKITSGAGFSCGILQSNNKVVCWGESEVANEIQSQFGGLSVQNLVAGESHACALIKNGTLICKGSNAAGQLNVPSHSPFEFSNWALAANYSCALRHKNGSVVCWGEGSQRSEFLNSVVKSISFEVIVSATDVICGLTTTNLSVFCWGPGFSGEQSSGNLLPLETIIPGPCVQVQCRMCGAYPDSGSLCAGTGTICKQCEVELPIPALLPPMPPSGTSSQGLQPTTSSSRARYRLLLAFGVVGSIGAFAGICTIVYCIVISRVCGICSQRIPSPGQSGAADHVLVAAETGPRPTSNMLPEKGDDAWRLTRQRSGTSQRHVDRAEIFSLSELSAATQNFSLENKIGGGSFGNVYKGKLADGREVAIKRGEKVFFTKKFLEKENAFHSELALLSRLHHKHLVELVGFCEENDERLLVYEYMSNGSLFDHLHRKNNLETDILNSWKMRIKVALDAARGIEYLHNYAVPPIIHRDIKSSNILLDSNWNGKVSDFGLSLMGSESEYSVSTKAAGTVGYIDPEYYVLNILTVKSDIYGLGVVLLELLTGKRAVFRDEGTNPTGVVEYAEPLILSGELDRILDKRIGLPEKNEAEAVEIVAHTALNCLKLEGKDRPTVTEILTNLEKALQLFEGIQGSTFNTASSITSE